MDPEERFYYQLAKSIQAWLSIEAETFFLYSAIMRGANSHLVSATFHHIQSFDGKLGLVNTCLALILDTDSDEWKTWKNLFNRADKLNKKRLNSVTVPC